MIKRLFVLMFLVCGFAAHADGYRWQVYRVIDGDTVSFRAPWVPQELGKYMSVRVYGIDTPEKGGRAKCASEAAMSVKATEFTRNFISNGDPVVYIRQWDKYGGRIVGSIEVNGKDLATEMIAKGLARPYFGGAKRSWCR